MEENSIYNTEIILKLWDNEVEQRKQKISYSDFEDEEALAEHSRYCKEAYGSLLN